MSVIPSYCNGHHGTPTFSEAMQFLCLMVDDDNKLEDYARAVAQGERVSLKLYGREVIFNPDSADVAAQIYDADQLAQFNANNL